jgi:hypothetical protein
MHHIFITRHDGPFEIFEQELHSVAEFTEEQLGNMILETPEKFTPGFIQIYNDIIVKENLFQTNQNICL